MGGHLIEMHRVELLHHKCLPLHIYAVDCRVGHKYVNLLAKHLFRVTPHDGVLVEREFPLFRGIDQGVAHRLHVGAIGADVEIAVELAVHGVGVDVIGEHPYGVGMDIQRIGALREVARQRPLRSHGLTGLLKVDAVVAGEYVLILGVFAGDVIECLHHAGGLVVINGVAAHDAVASKRHRSVVKARLLALGVVIAEFGIDAVAVAVYIRRSDSFRPFRLRIVVERIGNKLEIFIGEHHVVVED